MNGVDQKEYITIVNAKENNLKNITISIPLNSFTCVVGPSGCGKSSLIYDTLYAESQRNFLQSMSVNLYGQKIMDKPKVDKIINLRPALNVSQVSYNTNPRSTVGTATDISYFLRTLFSLIAINDYKINVDMSYFSSNNPSSFCKKCHGTGEEYYINENLLIPNEEKTLNNGAILYYKGNRTSLEYKTLESVCETYNIDINKRFCDLTNQEKTILLYRDDIVSFLIRFKTQKGRYKTKQIQNKGLINELNEKLENVDVPSVFSSISKYLSKRPCSKCHGYKLKKEVLDIRVCEKNLAEVENIPLNKIYSWLHSVKEKYEYYSINAQVNYLLNEIKKRVDELINLNLGYLCLSRNIPSLSSGESQRVRIANQITGDLSGLVYILDEPCRGLHYLNVKNIVKATKKLIDKGNTVIAIEHNKSYISNANQIIELGPVGGPEGGKVISSGLPSNFKLKIKFKEKKKFNNYVELKNINYHNLKNINVKFPIGHITSISGVSGTGKSSLIDVLFDSLSNKKAINCGSVSNGHYIKKVLYVDQKPIGKTPRSTIISYLGIYDEIREIFSKTDDATKYNLKSSDFSMNVAGGRCEECLGTGRKKIELTYMPDSYIKCPVCKGKRFKKEVLFVEYKGYNINDILDLPITKVKDIFSDKPNIIQTLDCMIEIGLGYLSLGQMSMNLSGGESQRVKLVKYLGTKNTGKSLYILDEPTTGLGEKDILLLENIINKLNQMNETIVIIEHNIEFITNISDYLIDLGVKAGDEGGNVIISGYPKDVVNNTNSSWSFLKNI